MERDAAARRTVGDVRRIVIGSLTVVLAVAGVTALFVLFAQLADVPFDYFSRDVSAVLEGPFYAGTYAQLTILVWSVPAAVALTAAYVMRRVGLPARARLLLAAGLITAIMVIDDMFLVHESLAKYLHITEKAEPAAYLLMIVGFTYWFRRQLGVNALLALGALGCWGISATLDNLLHLSSDFAVEDGMKLVGVGIWTYMVLRLATDALIGPRGARADDELPGAEGALDDRSAARAAGRADDLDDLDDDEFDDYDDLDDEDLAAASRGRAPAAPPPLPVGAAPQPPLRPARTPARRFEESATTPIPARERPPRPPARPVTESATVATSNVRPRPPAGPARNGAPRHGGTTGAHSWPERSGDAPVARTGRARHRSDDD